MTFLRLTSIAIRRLRRLLPHSLNCWQVLLAAVMLVAPGASLLEGQEVELTESSAPVEERGDCSEFFATPGAALTRRSWGRATSAFGWKRFFDGGIRFPASHPRSERFVSGHRLANGLCAPRLC